MGKLAKWVFELEFAGRERVFDNLHKIHEYTFRIKRFLEVSL